MFHCPKCHNAAHARTSRYFSDMTNERYHQCTYINCSCTFFTVETQSFSIFSPVKLCRYRRTRQSLASSKPIGCNQKKPVFTGLFVSARFVVVMT
ncbi:ogr/Delta-like zinc finger family protein [Lelliottia amnigena]|uniref:ogr/Delta-like zinc finger family protein n=1 Tax=Lelliottia amnigena TaxID=61646 RepID=UPI003B58B3BD